MAKILVVDDSMVVAGVLQQFLEEQGYEVILASDGLEGILTAYKEIPDLIISDVEMPRLQGYQMSRLLKKRREMQKIPIIMHTSLSEDRDRFWALSSGADGYVTKDFDNLEKLHDLIRELLASTPEVETSIIEEDAKEVTEQTAMEMLGSMFDRELFRSTIMNELGAVEKHIASLGQSAKSILELLTRVCEAHISGLVLNYGNTVLAYFLPSDQVFHSDFEDFRTLCRSDFSDSANPNSEDFQQVIFNLEEREDFEKLRSDHRRLSSYTFFPLVGKGEQIIGTLHVGNLSNNYFSDTISDAVHLFCQGSAMVLENALLFNRISSMEKKIREVFSKFVPPEVIHELLERTDTNTEMKVGEKRSVAILFSDIRSFTVISENNSAEKIVSFLNNYFQIMVSEIKKEGGVIDKFIGDAILAIFGAPVSYEDNAARAVRAALGMIEQLPHVDSSNMVLPPGGFQIGVGIHEGSVIVGNIGSQDKFDYTVIGDNVNLASRLEGITKHYHRKIILSQTVAEKVEDFVPIREVDTVKVKGKEQSTVLYSPETLLDDPLDDEAAEAYRKGLQLYRMRSWTTAIEYFQKVLDRNPEDFLAGMYIQRCMNFSNKDPGKEWDGSVVLDFK